MFFNVMNKRKYDILGVQAYLAGLAFALAASPCSTPVLATLLGYVAASKDPVVGGNLLLTYTTGYVTPLLLAASFAGALQSLLSFRKFSAWINPMSGAVLLGEGVCTLSWIGSSLPRWQCRFTRTDIIRCTEKDR